MLRTLLRFFDNASKLILVSTADMRATAGTLQIFERPELSAGWKGAASPERVVVGYNGLGWAHPFRDKAINDEPLKFEGDKRTPAGIFQLGAAFGFSATDKSDYFQLKYSETFCVNDPRSPHYNKIVPRSVAGWRTSGEDMRSVDLYRRGLVINYPTNASQRGGPAFFFMSGAQQIHQQLVASQCRNKLSLIFRHGQPRIKRSC